MGVLDRLLATSWALLYFILKRLIYFSIGTLVLLIGLLRFYIRFIVEVCVCKQDMTGKTVLITGASAGIGKYTAYEMAKRNARVLLGCRNLEKANGVAAEIRRSTGNSEVFVKKLDLNSFNSVKTCVEDILKTEQSLHVLINNAGVENPSEKMTEDDCETTMQSNHLGHFLLTLLLLDLLKRSASSRIINVASVAYILADLDLNDLNLDLNNKRKLWPFRVYSNTKLANILFTNELAQRLDGTGVTVNSLHPGLVKTDIMAKKGIRNIIPKIYFAALGKTVEEGAQTTIHLAVSPDLVKTTGKYFRECKESLLWTQAANDRMLARRLFEISEEIVGVQFRNAAI